MYKLIMVCYGFGVGFVCFSWPDNINLVWHMPVLFLVINIFSTTIRSSFVNRIPRRFLVVEIWKCSVLDVIFEKRGITYIFCVYHELKCYI